ncbi:TlpA family protein disulfide reductase [Polaribacter sp. BAL334]|uniref:TlpA family protein disulfide reductase n=1 Tax=Polaribacter sp. BAL334 TaxID=1708178 RepID=UPI0018D20B4D|nr:TlpA disulfide reductase family protein [Polaribacter sp. BAL334]MBG7610907.1 TlpA family protein disulfide reductase [Polaribacter sp. BAL334]
MKKVISIISLLILISCDKTESKIKKAISDKITLIIKNDLNIKTNIGSGVNRKNFDRIDIDIEKKLDTINIDALSNLKLYIKNQNTFTTVLCKSGDTLLINIYDNDTKIQFKNTVLKKYDTLSLEDIYKLNSKDLIINHNKLYEKFMKVDESSNRITPNYQEIKSDIVAFRKLDESSEKKFYRKKQILKNIFDKNLISSVNYDHELSQLNFKYFLSIVESYNASDDAYFLNKIKNIFFESNLAFNDPFVSYGFLNVFISQIIYKEENNGIVNFSKVYDLLPTYFEANPLKLFREFCLHQMTEQKESSEIVLNYLNSYKNEYDENSFTTFFEKKYLTKEKQLSVSSNLVELIDDKSNRISLDELIKKHQGNLVYVDFWASWCAPCRAEMPSSKKLQNEFKDSKIKFIYISIDTDKNKWEKAFKEELITENNFFALNYPKADFYNNFNLKTIPRYIIFDAKGNLIYENAPRPSDKRLKEIILENLN